MLCHRTVRVEVALQPGMHQEPGDGYGDDEGQEHQSEVVEDEAEQDAAALSSEYLLDGYVLAFWVEKFSSISS